jgi:hypothetical protein
VFFNFITLVTILRVAVETDATEVYFGFNKDWMDGAFSTSVTNYVVVSDDAWGFEDMDGEMYHDLTVDVPIGSTPLTLSGHVGTKHLVKVSTYDYTDWKVNADYAFNDNFSAGAFYTDTDQDEADWTVGSTFLGDSTLEVT